MVEASMSTYIYERPSIGLLVPPSSERVDVPCNLEQKLYQSNRVRFGTLSLVQSIQEGQVRFMILAIDILAVPAPTHPFSMISQSLRRRENSRREVDLATNTTVAGRRGQAVRVLAGTRGVLRLEAAESDGARVVNGLVVLAEHRVTGDHAEALQQQLVTIEVLCAREDLTLGNAVTLPTWM